MPAEKVLLVDDDVALVEALEQVLLIADYEPLLAYTAEKGIQIAMTQNPDLILLDVMVPLMGGWEACRKLREILDETPIIFLTALGNVENVVQGLEIGADDYLVKPVKHAEFLARIKAHLRRVNKIRGSSMPKQLVFREGLLVIDVPSRLVTVAGKEVSLTPREYELLITLASNPGRVITTADLVRRAWGMSDQTATDNIKPYIHYLRKKLEAQATSPRWIKTVRGVGYRFED